MSWLRHLKLLLVIYMLPISQPNIISKPDLQALASSKNSESNVLLILNVTFDPFANDNCTKHHNIICAEYSLEAECNTSCSYKVGGSASCQWIHEG